MASDNNIKNQMPKSQLPYDKPEQLLDSLHSFEGRLADTITYFSGSMMFVYFHVVWFSFWILANNGTFEPYIMPFDVFPYGLLTMIVSLEAIFLSTFIMISQNRQALVETYRELEELEEHRQDELEQEELEEEVEDIQKDLDEIKDAMIFITKKLETVEQSKLKKVATTGKKP